MNIGEKISLYKEKLGFKNYQLFGNAVGVSGDWLNDLSKKSDLKFVDVSNLGKLCGYLQISIEQLIKDDKTESNDNQAIEIIDVEDCNDIGFMISEIVSILGKKDTEIKLDGILLNNKAKQMCKDALDVVKVLTKQYL